MLLHANSQQAVESECHPPTLNPPPPKKPHKLRLTCNCLPQGSHFFRLTKFHDISMIFPGFLVIFQIFFSLFLKYDFQVVLNINMQTY